MITDAQRYQHLFENKKLKIVGGAPNGLMNKVNKAFCEMLGYSEEALSKIKMTDLTFEEDVESTNLMINKMIDGQINHFNVNKRYKHKNCGIVYVSTNVSGIYDEDKLVETIAVIEDLTNIIDSKNKLENTPLDAINASSDNIAVAHQKLFDIALFSIRNFSESQISFLSQLIKVGLQPSPILSSREERTMKNKYINDLNQHDIQNPEEVAELLISQNVTSGITQWIDDLYSTNMMGILKIANDIVSIQNNNNNIALAVKKANKIIHALKKFTYHHQDDEKVETNMLENIDTVLTIYHNHLKKITLVTNLEDVGSIMGHPDELAQVWTNLIHNALYAIGQEGQITIGLEKEDNKVIVSIEDNGVGISEEHQKNIFTPFYTTKPIGEGSGGEALEIIEELQKDGLEPNLVISDQIMPKMKGDDLLSIIHEKCPQTNKVLLTEKPWDITDFNLTVKQALNSYSQELNIKKKNIELKEVNKKLTQSNIELDTFLYRFSHDLKSPVTTLEGLCNLGQVENDTSYYEQQKGVINNMLLLLKKIVHVGEIRNKTISPESVVPKDIINESVRLLIEKSHPEVYDLSIDVDKVTVICDIVLFNITIDNILQNAFVYSYFSKEKSITIMGRFHKDTFVLTFKNSHIPSSVRPNDILFEMFYKRNDYGLGLYISKTAAKKAGISLALSSPELNIFGSSITLPLNKRHPR